MSDRLSKTKTDKPPFRVMPVLAVIALSPVAAYAQDAATGAKVFQRCAMCHSTNASGPAKMGPSLAGVVGGLQVTNQGFAIPREWPEPVSTGMRRISMLSSLAHSKS
jgi:cytochrome c2